MAGGGGFLLTTSRCRNQVPGMSSPRVEFACAAKSSSRSAAGRVTWRLCSQTPRAPSPFTRRDLRQACHSRGASSSSALRDPLYGYTEVTGGEGRPRGARRTPESGLLALGTPSGRACSGTLALGQICPAQGAVARATRLRQSTWSSARTHREWEAGPWSWANRILGTEQSSVALACSPANGIIIMRAARVGCAPFKGNAGIFLRSACLLVQSRRHCPQ